MDESFVDIVADRKSNGCLIGFKTVENVLFDTNIMRLA